MYNVHLYNVECILYNVQCTFVQCRMYIVQGQQFVKIVDKSYSNCILRVLIRSWWMDKEIADQFGYSIFVIDYLEAGVDDEGINDVRFHAKILDDMNSCKTKNFVWIECDESGDSGRKYYIIKHF